MSSSAEAELGSGFQNSKKACPLWKTLDNMGYTQPPTPIKMDKSTTEGIINKMINLKRSKAISIRFHWITYRVRQKQFRFHWKPGTKNMADYLVSLPYAPRTNAKYILCQVSKIGILRILQGCVDMHVKPCSKRNIIQE